MGSLLNIFSTTVVGVHIPLVFREPFLECSLRFSNILLGAFPAPQQIYYITGKAVPTSRYILLVVCSCSLNNFPLFDEWTNTTFIAFLGARAPLELTCVNKKKKRKKF